MIEVIKHNKYFENSRSRINFHIAFWLITTLFSLILLVSFDNGLLPSFISKSYFLPFQVSAAYFIIFIMFERVLYRGKYLLFVLGSAVFAFALSLLAYLLHDYILQPLLTPSFEPPAILDIIKDLEGLISYYMRSVFIIPFILCSFEFVFSQYNKIRKTEILTSEMKKAELDFLKTQIHPEFLISTLRNLQKLTASHSEVSTTVIEKLSDVLEYILYQGRKEVIDIGSELTAIENYIELENIRFKEKTEIKLEINCPDRSIKVTPLILFSFLEHNFKGYQKEKIYFAQCDVLIKVDQKRICASIKNNKIIDNKFNDIYDFEKMNQQLDIVYPEKHMLKQDKSAEFIEMKLEIVL